MPNAYDFTGRAAVVTGGARGIGRAVAERLAAGGARLALWDRDAAKAEETARELGGETIAVTVDVVDYASVERARDATVERFGRIDVLINNAGISGPNVPTKDYALDAWKQVLAINLDGPFHCCRAVVPVMIDQGYGRIVNVASIAGKEGNPNAPAYSASKAGLIALTKTLGKELASYDIGVNAVTPAVAKTEIFDQMTEEHVAYMLSKIPRARFVQVEEVASVIAFAASEDCSFTTGAVFDVSGGRATY